MPEITVTPRTDDDEYLILACDGIWDVFSNDDMAVFVQEKMASHINAVSLRRQYYYYYYYHYRFWSAYPNLYLAI